jgi:hypothetical protein
MRKVIAEFLTTDSSAPNSYGDSGCMLISLQETPLVLRHEHYTRESQHRIYLFARDPEMGVQAQVFIYIYPMQKGKDEYKKDIELYVKQQKKFRLPHGQSFDSSFLAPSNSLEFQSHTAFRTRDGKYRCRVVHSFIGIKRTVLLVYSINTVNFLDSKFFNYVKGHLSLADTDIEFDD